MMPSNTDNAIATAARFFAGRSKAAGVDLGSMSRDDASSAFSHWLTSSSENQMDLTVAHIEVFKQLALEEGHDLTGVTDDALVEAAERFYSEGGEKAAGCDELAQELIQAENTKIANYEAGWVFGQGAADAMKQAGV
ncbi:hypothetical protein EBT31_04340, partial [bacterium]|nr:hypothetical protein [bacterium]